MLALLTHAQSLRSSQSQGEPTSAGGNGNMSPIHNETSDATATALYVEARAKLAAMRKTPGFDKAAPRR